MNNLIQIENNQLAQNILKTNYFDYFKKGNQKSLEIFLLGHCSAQCKYCYLVKHPELYPQTDLAIILDHLQLILNWYIENHFINEIDIFSAEWLNIDSFRDKVFTIFYNSFKDSKYKPPLIVIPSNMQFIHNKNSTKKIQEWIDLFKKINIPICISASVDGKYCDDDRTACDDTFYKELYNFLTHNQFLAHPMISSYNVDKWIQNYNWWLKTFPGKISDNLMTLEVRDETWTNESIQNLLEFFNYVIDYKFLHIFNKNKLEFLKYILGIHHNKEYFIPYNSIQLFSEDVFNQRDDFTCTVGHSNLTIRVGDLSIPICHRLGYDELLLGKFNVEDNKITTFEVYKPELLIMKTHLKRNCLPHCESCKYIGCCTGFCMGNSYEVCKNPLIPTMEVCKMYKTKINFLISKYLQMGLFEYLPKIKTELGDEVYTYLNDLILDIGQELSINNAN